MKNSIKNQSTFETVFWIFLALCWLVVAVLWHKAQIMHPPAVQNKSWLESGPCEIKAGSPSHPCVHTVLETVSGNVSMLWKRNFNVARVRRR